MYTIYYSKSNSWDELPVFDLKKDADQYHVLSATLELEKFKAGKLTFTIPVSNPAASMDSRQIIPWLDDVIVYRDGTEIFRGRPIAQNCDFNNSLTYTCEGALGYLNDTIIPEFYSYDKTMVQLIRDVLNTHNTNIGNREKRRIYAGNIIARDPSQEGGGQVAVVAHEEPDYKTTFEVLEELTMNKQSLWRPNPTIKLRYDKNQHRIFFDCNHNAPKKIATQNIEFGENLLDLSFDIDYGELYTAIVPIGPTHENWGGRKANVTSVNGGSIYVKRDSAVNVFGLSAKVIDYSNDNRFSPADPTNLNDVANELLNLARNDLATAWDHPVKQFSIKAVDLATIDSSKEYFEIGDFIKVHSHAHYVLDWYELTAMSIDFLSPENTTYTFDVVREG